MAGGPLVPRLGPGPGRDRPARPPPPALRTTAAAAGLRIGGRPGQRGPATVGRTPGPVPLVLGRLTADREGTGPTPTLATLAAAAAALIIGLPLGRRLVLWLLTGLSTVARQIRPRCQPPEVVDPRAPAPRWRCLATAASRPPPARLPIEDGKGGADPEVPVRLLRAEVRQHLEGIGIDVLKVATEFPRLERYDVERVQRVTACLAGLGADVRRVVETHPGVLEGQVERYEAVAELLRANGVDVANVVNRLPRVLDRRTETLQRNIAAIAGCGHPVAEVVRRQPRALLTPPARISAMLQLHSLATPPKGKAAARALAPTDPMVALLSSVGLDAGRLLKRAPGAFNLSVSHLQAVVANLKRIGVDVPKVLQSAPSVLNLLPETVLRVVHFLAENGLDPVYLINKRPTLLTCSVERKLQPTLTFVVEEMGRSRAELRMAPTLWTHSLEGRLRPRFQYLESLGVSDFTLSSFAAYPDDIFAEVLAETGLGHYYAWRQANGHAVPPGWLSASGDATPQHEAEAEDDIDSIV